MADFPTIKHWQTIALALAFTHDNDPYISKDQKRENFELRAMIDEHVKTLITAPAVEVDKTYRVDNPASWANGKLVVIDRVANGVASFASLEDKTGGGFLPLDSFKPVGAHPGISLGHTYTLDDPLSPMHGKRVVVVKLPADQSTAVVHCEGSPGEVFCCLCVKLKEAK